MDESDIRFGCHEGNVHLLLTAPCGDHEKVMSAQVARSMGQTLIRLADQSNDQLPSFGTLKKQPIGPVILLALALNVYLFSRR